MYTIYFFIPSNTPEDVRVKADIFNYGIVPPIDNGNQFLASTWKYMYMECKHLNQHYGVY